MAAESISIGPTEGSTHTHTVVFLHGRDSLASEFASELFESEASDDLRIGAVTLQPGQLRTLPNLLPTVRWVFPAAPILSCQRFETKMSQWFDMWSVESPDERSELQEDGLRASVAFLSRVIAQEEARGVPRAKIFLAGISQGFATAVTAFLRGEQGFAGLVGLCSWMPFSREDITQDQRRTPVFLAHSVDDGVVPVGNGRRMRDSLQVLLDSVEWHEYKDGGHWVNEPLGVDDLFHFIKAHM